MLRSRFLAVLALAGANFFVAATSVHPQDSEPGPKTPPGFDLATEMTDLYGNYHAPDGLSLVASPSDPSQKLDVRAFFLAVIPDSGEQEVLLATYAVPDEGTFNCHACLPLIGAALLRKSAVGWTREAFEPPSFMFGEGGEPPDATLVQFGPHRYGIELEDTGDHGGRSYAETALFLPWNGGFSDAFYRTTMEDTSSDESGCGPSENKTHDGGPICFAYHTELKFVSGSRPDYYDLVIKTSGTRLDPSGKVVDASRIGRFQLIDGKYQ